MSIVKRTFVAFSVGIIGLLGGCSVADQVLSERERGPFMRLMEADLHTYSHEHNECFPNGHDQWDALEKLYPRYCSGFELAGLSGNIRQVTNALQRGLSLSNLTSWHYVAGLRTDDLPQLAILWESKPGLSADGSSAPSGGRAVLLVGGDITNVPSANWGRFLNYQRQLYEATESKRAAQTNAFRKGD